MICVDSIFSNNVNVKVYAINDKTREFYKHQKKDYVATKTKRNSLENVIYLCYSIVLKDKNVNIENISFDKITNKIYTGITSELTKRTYDHCSKNKKVGEKIKSKNENEEVVVIIFYATKNKSLAQLKEFEEIQKGQTLIINGGCNQLIGDTSRAIIDLENNQKRYFSMSYYFLNKKDECLKDKHKIEYIGNNHSIIKISKNKKINIETSAKEKIDRILKTKIKILETLIEIDKDYEKDYLNTLIYYSKF